MSPYQTSWQGFLLMMDVIINKVTNIYWKSLKIRLLALRHTCITTKNLHKIFLRLTRKFTKTNSLKTDENKLSAKIRHNPSIITDLYLKIPTYKYSYRNYYKQFFNPCIWRNHLGVSWAIHVELLYKFKKLDFLNNYLLNNQKM